MVLNRGELRIEPAAEILSAARTWLDRVRPALEPDFIAAYLTGSVLNQGFDIHQSRINVLVVSRSLGSTQFEALAKAIPASVKSGPRFEPLFMSQSNIEKSLDSFPIEWLEIQERRLLLEGEDVVDRLQISHTDLRLQCERELRGKFIQLRQTYILHHAKPADLDQALAAAASGFAALFRTLLRLRGEIVPSTAGQVIERVADVFGLDAQGLLAAHLARYAGRKRSSEEALGQYRVFLAEIERLTAAIDQLRVP
jgi:hypothetical protein